MNMHDLAQITSPLAPASPQAHSISELIIGVIVLASTVALVVSGLIAWSIVRYRDKEGAIPSQTEGNRKVEIIYTIIPLLIMATLFCFSVMTMGRAEPASDKPSDLVIIAHQWWWEIRYPESGIVTANEIHLPAGIPMNMELRSADVIHELWAPQLAPKMDLVPGQNNRLTIQGDSAGVYLGTCAEFCGVGHAWMRVRVIVQTPEEFKQWESAQRLPPQPVMPAGERGRAMFFARSCIQCHAIDGTSAQGDTGPNLTHLASRATLASGVLDNTPENLRLWLADPQTIKPGCHMPNMKLTNEEVDQIAKYLESLK